jgi:hypothetical protein
MGPTATNLYRLRPYPTTLAFRHSRAQSFQKEKKKDSCSHTHLQIIHWSSIPQSTASPQLPWILRHHQREGERQVLDGSGCFDDNCSVPTTTCALGVRWAVCCCAKDGVKLAAFYIRRGGQTGLARKLVCTCLGHTQRKRKPEVGVEVFFPAKSCCGYSVPEERDSSLPLFQTLHSSSFPPF